MTKNNNMKKTQNLVKKLVGLRKVVMINSDSTMFHGNAIYFTRRMLIV